VHISNYSYGFFFHNFDFNFFEICISATLCRPTLCNSCLHALLNNYSKLKTVLSLTNTAKVHRAISPALSGIASIFSPGTGHPSKYVIANERSECGTPPCQSTYLSLTNKHSDRSTPPCLLHCQGTSRTPPRLIGDP